jgi:hypothetical protein
VIVNIPALLEGYKGVTDELIDELGARLARSLPFYRDLVQVSYSERGELHVHVDEEAVGENVDLVLDCFELEHDLEREGEDE